MKIIVDADACPTKDIIENVASKENIKLVFVCDNSNMILCYKNLQQTLN